MNNTRFFTTLLAIFIAFSAYCHDHLVYSYGLFISSEIEITSNEPIEVQERKLALIFNHLLASSIDYPLEARENGDEGLVRAVIYFDPVNSTADIQFARGNHEILEAALREAYNKLNLLRFVSDDYQGKRVIPIKINFELED